MPWTVDPAKSAESVLTTFWLMVAKVASCCALRSPALMPTTSAAAVADAALRLLMLFEVTLTLSVWPMFWGVVRWIPLTPEQVVGLVELRPLAVFDVTAPDGVLLFTWIPVMAPPPEKLVIVLVSIVIGAPVTTMPVRVPEGAGDPPQLLHVLP